LATAVDTITSYAKKDVQGKFGPSTLTIFQTQSGREYSTFKGEIASQANLLIGVPNSVIEYDEVRKGEYTNYYLTGAKAGDGQTANAAPAAATVAPSSKDEAIARAVALKAAVDTLPSLGEPTKDPASVIALADFYLTWLQA
jgi:hypothetical protein